MPQTSQNLENQAFLINFFMHLGNDLFSMIFVCIHSDSLFNDFVIFLIAGIERQLSLPLNILN